MADYLPVGVTSRALAFVAASGALSESLLKRAGIGAGVIQPAVVAHVLERIDGTIRFTHPLLSSVVYRDLGERRWRVHAAIRRVARAGRAARRPRAVGPRLGRVLGRALGARCRARLPRP